jgi:hypothetical protein
VLVNYYPKLGDYTDEWGMVNDEGEGLRIGVLHFNNTKTSTFCSRVHPRDVKAALSMLSYLFLKNCHVSKEDSLLFDSAMLLVKQSSSGLNIHFNSIGKPNHMFAWFVIDFLSMLLLFDIFVNHRSLMAPAPYGHKDLTDQEQEVLKHNQKILINFCFSQLPMNVQKYFMNARTGDIGQGCVNLDSLWATSTKVLCQSKTGIVSLFESYKATYTNIKKEQPLWIHHFAILQFFHGKTCKTPHIKKSYFVMSHKYSPILYISSRCFVFYFQLPFFGHNCVAPCSQRCPSYLP